MNCIKKSSSVKFNKLIAKDFAYGLVEIFTNQNFNMQRLKPLDFSDLKKDYQDAKVSFKQLTKDEKKVYKAKIHDLLSKHKEEKARRIEELKLSGMKHKILKIKNDAFRGTTLNFYLAFNNDEIEMAKICLLNSWDFPPPTFFDPFFIFKKKSTVVDPKKEIIEKVKDDKIAQNKESKEKESKDKEKLDDTLDSNEPAKSPTKSSGWSRDIYLQLLHNNIDIYNDPKEPLKRIPGHWINYSEFSNLMNNYIILHNTKYYKNSLVIDNNWYNFKNEIYEPNFDNKVFLLSPPSDTSYNNNCKTNEDKKSLLIVFEPNYSRNKNFSNIGSYITIQIINKNGEEATDEICLKDHFSTMQLDILEPNRKYYLLIKDEVTPLGYNLTLYSDYDIEAINTLTFLKNEKKMIDYNFKNEHPPIKANSFYLLMKLKLEVRYLFNKS